MAQFKVEGEKPVPLLSLFSAGGACVRKGQKKAATAATEIKMMHLTYHLAKSRGPDRPPLHSYPNRIHTHYVHAVTRVIFAGISSDHSVLQPQLYLV